MVTLATLIYYTSLDILVRISLPDNTKTFSIRQLLRIERKKILFPNCSMVKQEGIAICRWKKFKGIHVHSNVKKKRLKDEKLKRDYPEVCSNFSLEVVDKTLVNMFDNL